MRNKGQNFAQLVSKAFLPSFMIPASMPSLHQRQQQQQPLADPFPISPHQINTSQRSSPFFSTVGFFISLLSLIILLGIFYPWFGYSGSLFPSSDGSLSKWRDYTLAEAAAFVAKDGTVIVCAVNEKWPGHAVLLPPAPDAQTAHKFGSLLGYNVMYNDVDMIWLKDPFPFFEGNHDVYFTDDLAMVKDLWRNESKNSKSSHGLAKQANDHPAFNCAWNKTAGQVDMYLLLQAGFPLGGLYFKNQIWVQETKGMHVIIHNNYITGFEKKIKRFQEYCLWLLDDYANESSLGRI